jgi:hypothetical protein
MQEIKLSTGCPKNFALLKFAEWFSLLLLDVRTSVIPMQFCERWICISLQNQKAQFSKRTKN